MSTVRAVRVEAEVVGVCFKPPEVVVQIQKASPDGVIVGKPTQQLMLPINEWQLGAVRPGPVTLVIEWPE